MSTGVYISGFRLSTGVYISGVHLSTGVYISGVRLSTGVYISGVRLSMGAYISGVTGFCIGDDVSVNVGTSVFTFMVLVLYYHRRLSMISEALELRVKR